MNAPSPIGHSDHDLVDIGGQRQERDLARTK